MEEQLLQFFENYHNYAVLISILLNVTVAVLGVVPSFFVTAANVIFFGFWQGTLISLAGEALGAIVSFWLYRKGFKEVLGPVVDKYPKARKLINSDDREAFLLILGLRIMPFVPSGIVTLAAAIGKVSLVTFVIASSLGKIPALLIEAFSVAQFLKVTWLQNWILELILIYGVYKLWKRKKFF